MALALAACAVTTRPAHRGEPESNRGAAAPPATSSRAERRGQVPNVEYFPDEISVTGTPDELLALRSVPDFHRQDHGHVLGADGRLTVVGYTNPAITSDVVAQIQAL